MRQGERSTWPARAWEALTRRREHQLLDALLGLFALIAFLAWADFLAPGLRMGLFLAAMLAYVIALWRRERQSRGRPNATVMPAGIGVLAALNELDAKLSEAREIPLTREARLDPAELAPLIEEVRMAARVAGEEGRAETLARAVLDGRAILGADQVRFDRRKALRAVADLREHLIEPKLIERRVSRPQRH